MAKFSVSIDGIESVEVVTTPNDNGVYKVFVTDDEGREHFRNGRLKDGKIRMNWKRQVVQFDVPKLVRLRHWYKGGKKAADNPATQRKLPRTGCDLFSRKRL